MSARAIRVLTVGSIVLALLFAGPSEAVAAGSYKVRPGDTLTAIARRHGIGVDALAAANGITDFNRVVAGRVLQIPDRPAGAAALSRGTGRLHRVRAGETLASIARANRTTVAALVAANGIRNPNRIIAGTELVVGGGAAWTCPVAGPSVFVDDYLAGRSGGRRRHLGIDLRAPRGTPVVASVSGVLEHQPSPLGGIAFKLHGDDGVDYYGAHLDRLLVPPGRVKMGQQIGVVGDTGNAKGTPTHLHFERRPGGGAHTNPMPYLLAACPQA